MKAESWLVERSAMLVGPFWRLPLNSSNCICDRVCCAHWNHLQEAWVPNWHHLNSGLRHSFFLRSCLLELLLHLYVLNGAGWTVFSLMLCPLRAIVKRALVILDRLVLLLTTEEFFAIGGTGSSTEMERDRASCWHFFDNFLPNNPCLLPGRSRHFSAFINLLMSVLIILLHYIAEIKYILSFLFIFCQKLKVFL